MIPSRAPGVVLPSPSAQLPPPLLALAHCNVQTLAALSCHALSSVLSCALVVLWPSVHTSCSSLVLGPHALASLSHLPSHAVMLVSRYAASATCTTVHTYSWCNMYHVENDVDLLHEPPLKTVCEVRRQPIRLLNTLGWQPWRLVTSEWLVLAIDQKQLFESLLHGWSMRRLR